MSAGATSAGHLCAPHANALSIAVQWRFACGTGYVDRRHARESKSKEDMNKLERQRLIVQQVAMCSSDLPTARDKCHTRLPEVHRRANYARKERALLYKAEVAVM